MKIGIINNLYKPYNRGGAEVVIEILINDLNRLKHNTFTISTCPGKSHQIENNYYLKSKYYNLNHWPFFLRLFWQIINIFNFKKTKEIKKIIKKEKPDLIITNNLMGLGLLSPKLFKKNKIKNIHIIHDIQLLHPSGLMLYKKENKINSLPALLYQKITRKLIGSPDIVISPSKWLMNLYKNKNFFKDSFLKIIPNPIKINPWKSKNKRYQNEFLYVGQIEKHKGIEILIKSFNKIKKYPLSIIGSGSFLKEAKKIAKDNIEFLGYLNKKEVEKIMLQKTALIVPSTCYENSPGVIYEAIGSKLPIIGSNLGGIAELINEYGGIMFEPNNQNDLIAQINYFLKNENEIEKHFPKKPLPAENYAQKIINLL